MLRHALERQFHGLNTDGLTVAVAAVQPKHHAVVGLNLYCCIGLKIALKHRVHITRRHAHAVRIMAAQIRQHQIGSDLLRFFGGAAAFFKQRGYFAGQRVAGNRV